MYRYEVALSVKNDIENVTKKSHFYTEAGKYYINEDARNVAINYYDLATDSYPTKTLDDICQDLYTTDFDAQSTQEEYSAAQAVELVNKITPSTKVPVVAVQKSEGSDFSRASHDWTKRTSWYTDSVRVTGETPTLDTGLVYDLANSNIINLVSGDVSDEDDFSAAYLVKVYDGGTEIAPASIDYENGKITLSAAPSGALTCDYSYENGSTYVLKPDPGKVLYLEHAEIQFSGAVTLGALEFQIWAYNPYDLPNKVMVKRKVYKNARDILNSANLGTGVIPKFGELQYDVQVFPFNYVYLQPLKDSQGLEMRLKITGDTPFGGEFATVTFYCISEDE